MFDEILDLSMHIMNPILFMSISGYYGICLFFKLLFSLQFRTLLSVSAFKEAWFASFWSDYGPGMDREVVDPWVKKAYGVVLDIGPGSGDWLALFDKSKITKIYGVEPNADHYELLRKRIKEAGLSDIYELVPAGVADIGKFELEEESFDSLVTVQCLCSIPDPKPMIASLYKYIKPGGQWVVFEHVITPHSGWIAWYQAAIDLFWPHFLGGCSITRDTGKWLREAGDWSHIDLVQPMDEPYYHVIPHAVGVLVK